MLEMAQRAGMAGAPVGMGGFLDFLNRPLTSSFSFSGSGAAPGIWDIAPDGTIIYDAPAPVSMPPVTTQPTQSLPTGNIWQAQLPALAAGGLQVIRDIFAPTQSTQAAYRSQTPTQTYYPNYPSTGIYQTPATNSGVGIRVDSGGLWLGNSRISWVWIIGGVGILFLLQSPGFTRKRNPERKVNPKRRRRSQKRRR